MNEQIPAMKIVSHVQNAEKSFVSEDQEVGEHAVLFLTHAKETAERSFAEEGESGENMKQVCGNSTGNNGGVIKGYLNTHLSYIKDIIQKNITYPDTARREGWMGKVTVSFVIAYNGCAKEIKVIKSSGFRILDRSAKEAVFRSSPFPHPPVEARIVIPILYTLR